jgi:HK97 family phage portal protein
LGFFSKHFPTFTNKTNYVKEWFSGAPFSNGYPSSSLDSDTSGENALKYSVVWACNRVLAETFATVPAFEYKRELDGDRTKTNDTGLLDILHYKYNDEMSAFAAKEMSMYQMNLGGNAVFTRQYNMFNDVIGLVPHKWQNVKIERNKETGQLEYTIKLSNETRKYSRDQVFHVAGPSTDGIIGMSPIEFAASSVQLGVTYEKFGQQFYKNGVHSSGVFSKDGTLTDEAYSRLKGELNKGYAGLVNSGKALLLEDGLQFTQNQIKLVDAELLSSKKFQTEEICRIYRMPLHLVQNLDKATNNNIEQQSLEFVMYTMLPHFKRQEDAINTQLLTRQQRDEGYYFEYNIATLLRGDQKSMYEAFAKGRQWGWLSVNDIRRMLNMNKIENGDIYLEPLNMVEAGTGDEMSTQISNKVSKEITQLMKAAN